MKDWKKNQLMRLRAEAVRLIERIDEANTSYELGLYQSRKMGAVKRASMYVNYEGIKLRKGYYNAH